MSKYGNHFIPSFSHIYTHSFKEGWWWKKILRILDSVLMCRQTSQLKLRGKKPQDSLQEPKEFKENKSPYNLSCIICKNCDKIAKTYFKILLYASVQKKKKKSKYCTLTPFIAAIPSRMVRTLLTGFEVLSGVFMSQKYTWWFEPNRPMSVQREFDWTSNSKAMGKKPIQPSCSIRDSSVMA